MDPAQWEGKKQLRGKRCAALLADLALTGSWPEVQGAQGLSGSGTQRLPAFVPNSGAVRTMHGAVRLVGAFLEATPTLVFIPEKAEPWTAL